LDLEEIGCAEVLMGIGKYSDYFASFKVKGFFDFVLLAAKVM
jgi:hypothetical protein